MATSECKRQQLSTSLSRHRENLGFRPSEELHHQQVCYLNQYKNRDYKCHDSRR